MLTSCNLNLSSARHITKVMESVRTKLREQCLRDVACYPEDLVDALRWFDYNWAEFEFRSVFPHLNCSTESDKTLPSNPIRSLSKNSLYVTNFALSSNSIIRPVWLQLRM